MRFGVIVFPGSNCDHDCYYLIKKYFSQSVEFVWHKETELSVFDIIILPGGFSYGDYLRCGAVARFSPIMGAISDFAKKGGMVLGICNGFQILLESGLLPGALLKNRDLKFICKNVFIKVENSMTPFTCFNDSKSILHLPIAHADGNYFVEKNVLKEMERKGQIVFRYCDQKGQVTDESNPNGSLGNIAGICNEEKNVLGLMPHPERACDEILNRMDGTFIFESILKFKEKINR